MILFNCNKNINTDKKDNIETNNNDCHFIPIAWLGHVAATREQLLLQTQKLASRRSEKPPKLPPRDNIYHPHDIPKPDYDDINEDDRLKAFRVKSDKGRDLNKKYGTYIAMQNISSFKPSNSVWISMRIWNHNIFRMCFDVQTSIREHLCVYNIYNIIPTVVWLLPITKAIITTDRFDVDSW